MSFSFPQNFIFTILFLIFLVPGCTNSNYPNTTTSSDGTEQSISQALINESPFQVVFADSVEDENGGIIENLKYVSNNNRLHINKNGHLVLAHYSGLMLEFSSDTIINMNLLKDSIARILGIDPLNNNRERVRARFLYSTIGSTPYGATSDQAEIELLLPRDRNKFFVPRSNPSMCLIWKYNEDLSNKNLELFITDIFNNQLDIHQLEDTRMTLDLSDHKPPGDLSIITIKEKYSDFTKEIGIRIGVVDYFMPSTCEPKLAIDAFQLAFFLESFMYYDEATKYYQSAAALSEKVFYSLMLKNHLTRQQKMVKD